MILSLFYLIFNHILVPKKKKIVRDETDAKLPSRTVHDGAGLIYTIMTFTTN